MFTLGKQQKQTVNRRLWKNLNAGASIRVQNAHTHVYLS